MDGRESATDEQHGCAQIGRPPKLSLKKEHIDQTPSNPFAGFPRIEIHPSSTSPGQSSFIVATKDGCGEVPHECLFAAELRGSVAEAEHPAQEPRIRGSWDWKIDRQPSKHHRTPVKPFNTTPNFR